MRDLPRPACFVPTQPLPSYYVCCMSAPFPPCEQNHNRLSWHCCSASAFVPSAPFVGSRVANVANPATSSLSMVAADMVGASAPLGFFDPMGFSKGPEERLNAYREAELKHGRTAMLAVVGFLTQARTK